jgi:hypothetical protein
MLDPAQPGHATDLPGEVILNFEDLAQISPDMDKAVLRFCQDSGYRNGFFIVQKGTLSILGYRFSPNGMHKIDFQKDKPVWQFHPFV